MKHPSLSHAAPPARPTASARRSAFTLIELLVVVAIIAVLASMLLPVLGKARRTAISARCMAQMKQLSLGLVQYAGDESESMPPTHDRDYSGGGIGVRIGLGAGIFYDDPGNTTRNVNWADKLLPYFGSADVYRCPVVSSVTPGQPGTINDYNHFGMNFYLDEKPKRYWGLPSVEKMNLVKRPSEIIAFVEKDIGNGVVNRSTGIPQAMPFDNNWFLNPYRHGANASSWAVAYVGSVGSANYTFVDGHVAALSGDTPGLVSGASLGATRHDSQASIDLLWAAGK